MSLSLPVLKDIYDGEGNGNPLQCLFMENPRDGAAWWAAVCGVAQGRTRLKRLSSSSNKQKASFSTSGLSRTAILAFQASPCWEELACEELARVAILT